MFFAFFWPISAHADDTVITSTGLSGLSGFGMTGGNPQVYAQRWIATQDGTVSTIDVAALKEGDSTATDGIRISIQANLAGVPSGTDLGHADISDGSLTTSCQVFASQSLSASVSVTNGSTYWLVYERQGALAAYPSRYDTCGESPNSYENSKWFDGSDWNTGNLSLYGKIYIVDSAPPPPPPPPPGGDITTSTSTPNGVIMRAESIMGPTFAIMLAMCIYFFIKLFAKKRRG